MWLLKPQLDDLGRLVGDRVIVSPCRPGVSFQMSYASAAMLWQSSFRTQCCSSVGVPTCHGKVKKLHSDARLRRRE